MYRMVAISVSFARKKQPASATANRASRTAPTRRTYFSHRRMPIVAASNPANIAKTAASRTRVDQSMRSLNAAEWSSSPARLSPALHGERLGQRDRGGTVDRFPESEGRFEVKRAVPQLGILGRLEDLANFGVNLALMAEHGERGPALGQVMGHARIVGVPRPQFADECGDPAVNSPYFIRHAAAARFLTALLTEILSISVSSWGGHNLGTNCWRYPARADLKRFHVSRIMLQLSRRKQGLSRL